MRDKNHKNESAYKAFAARFRLAVDRSHLMQTEIAELANVTETSISRYVNGERIPHPILLGKLCEVMRCDPAWLIGTRNKYYDDYERLKAGLNKIKADIAFTKRNIKSQNSDYLTGFISALSAVEGMIAEVEDDTN
jgi:transcriptional regulator with XRE-family HTH domain